MGKFLTLEFLAREYKIKSEQKPNFVSRILRVTKNNQVYHAEVFLFKENEKHKLKSRIHKTLVKIFGIFPKYLEFPLYFCDYIDHEDHFAVIHSSQRGFLNRFIGGSIRNTAIFE